MEVSISEGGGAAEGGADFFEKLKKHVKRKIKPDGSFGEESARLFERFLQHGNSLNSIGPLVSSAVEFTTGSRMKEDLNITCHRNTVKLYAVGCAVRHIYVGVGPCCCFSCCCCCCCC